MATPVELRVDEMTLEEVRAVKAFGRGEAQPHEQMLVMQVIVTKLSRANDLCYIPGNSDAGVFMSGRAFVGMQLIRLLRQPLTSLTTEREKSNGK